MEREWSRFVWPVGLLVSRLSSTVSSWSPEQLPTQIRCKCMAWLWTILIESVLESGQYSYSNILYKSTWEVKSWKILDDRTPIWTQRRWKQSSNGDYKQKEFVLLSQIPMLWLVSSTQRHRLQRMRVLPPTASNGRCKRPIRQSNSNSKCTCTSSKGNLTKRRWG